MIEALESLLGLPLHPLVVHAVVVLVPLVALGMLVVALSDTWALRLRWPLALLAVAAAAAALLARASGEALLPDVAGSAALGRHTDLGRGAAIGVVLACLAVVAWAALSRERRRPVLAAGATLAMLAVTAWVVVTGHAGAQAVWADVLASAG